MAEADWFFVRAGRQEGPTDLRTARGLIASGRLTASDLVWHDGMPDWQAAGEVPSLRDAFGAGTGIAALAPQLVHQPAVAFACVAAAAGPPHLPVAQAERRRRRVGQTPGSVCHFRRDFHPQPFLRTHQKRAHPPGSTRPR
jgi:hypothetical protein